CIETIKPDQRRLLVDLSKDIPHCIIEPEVDTVSYYLAGVPTKFYAHNGARDTEPLIQAATKQIAKIIKAKKAGDYIVILNKKTQPFRIFGSEPARLMERNPRIHTCERCFGPYNTAKCTFATICRDCGHTGCPVFPKVRDGHIKKPTAEERTGARKAGKAAYRAAVRDLKRETEPTS
ncbi:hypothetical protein QBC32DRAFT_391560, partial [Pseudoneurospora amorphoporcata]